MDYKKAYEDAMARMKLCQETGLKIDPIYIFPELKESENERIRKELLNAFQESEDSLYMVLTPNKRESFIAYLEKQGSQNLANSEKTCKDEQNPTLPDFEQQEGVAGRDYIPVEWVEAIENYGKWKIVRVNEQNPAWNENTQQWIDVIIKDYERRYEVDKDHRATLQIQIDILKSLKERCTWKPTDEQMMALDFAIDCVVPDEFNFKKASLRTLFNDLKKLKEE